MKPQEYNNIKKGDILYCTFDSGIRKDSKIELIASSKPRKIKSPWADSRITLKKSDSNFKCYLYLSNKGKISLALGDMTTSNLKINKL